MNKLKQELNKLNNFCNITQQLKKLKTIQGRMREAKSQLEKILILSELLL